MEANDQEKIKIAREYFMRADQGRADILELFHEDAEVYFPKFGFGFGRNSFPFQMGVSALPHDKMLRSIEILGTHVAPRVRQELQFGQLSKPSRLLQA
jgi:hypothetical protein